MCENNVTECRYYNCGECFAEPKSDYCGEIHGYNKCDKYEDCYYRQLQLAIQKLEKIEQILELYADSKIGTLQDNGTYRIDCGGNAMTGSFGLLNNPFGLSGVYTYDPRPAKEGLKIIEE